ncbi:MAG: inner membrane-spanning protein YciB [Woeseiaceae bacterium]
MQLLIDFLPIVLFFAAYFISDDFYTALLVIMVAAPVAMALQWMMTKTFNKMTAVSTALVVVLGGGALLLDNKMVFLWKPTVFYWFAAAAFLASQYFGSKPVIRRLMESAGSSADEKIELSNGKWNSLNLAWVLFFVVAGALNIYVAYAYSEPTWVKFKLFGLIGLTIVFIIGQSFWLAKQINESADE